MTFSKILKGLGSNIYYCEMGAVKKKKKKGWETLAYGIEQKTWPTLEALIILL